MTHECIICFSTFDDSKLLENQHDMDGHGHFRTYTPLPTLHPVILNNRLTQTKCCGTKICIECLYGIKRTTKKCPLSCPSYLNSSKFAPHFTLLYKRQTPTFTTPNVQRQCSRCGSSDHIRTNTTCPLYADYPDRRIPNFTSSQTRKSYIQVLKDLSDIIQERNNFRDQILQS